MTTASKQEQLQRSLDGIGRAVPDVEGALLASRDGLAIAASVGSAEPSRIAAMAATVLALGTTVVDTCRLGEFQETVIQSDGGVFVVYDAGDLAVLAVLARSGANLGLVHLEARRTAADLGRLLTSYVDEQPAPAPAVTPTAGPEPAPARPAATATAASTAPFSSPSGNHPTHTPAHAAPVRPATPAPAVASVTAVPTPA